MKRRKFLRLSSLATLPVILQSCDWSSDGTEFPITVHTDIHTGHLIFKSQSFPKEKSPRVNTLIVGGGIAGLSAANYLKGDDFLLCELSDSLGGTSSSVSYNGISFAQGAHYDLAYPSYYGDDVLGMMDDLGIIEFQEWKKSWSFKDKKYIIPHARKNRCFENGKFRSDVLVDGELKERFQYLLGSYKGQMPMPTPLIKEEHRSLNSVTFYDFLNSKLELTPEFKRGLDYHMLDDWGGTSEQVSALSGIHYFTCRPYDAQVVDLFSPPDGNGYFIKKLSSGLPDEQLKTRHLVKSVEKTTKGFSTEIIDVENQIVKEVDSDRVIYAGQKHALKYIMPEQYDFFKSNTYAPWLVVNFIVKNEIPKKGYWQNEMLMEDQTFMGFVDSDMQNAEHPNHRVLTAYYCLSPESRNDLKNVEANREVIVEKTLGYLNQYFESSIESLIEQVFIKVIGHAMPIPKPGYLFNDKNNGRLFENMTFAGVDNARLPLLFEAIDSGIQAAKLLGK